MYTFKNIYGESRAFSLDLRFSRFLILCFGNPHLLKASQRGQNASADPGPVSSFRGSVGGNQFKSHIGRGLHAQIPVESIREPGEQRVSAGDDDASVERGAQIDVAHADGGRDAVRGRHEPARDGRVRSSVIRIE